LPCISARIAIKAVAEIPFHFFFRHTCSTQYTVAISGNRAQDVPGIHRAPSCKPKTFSWQLKLGHGKKNGLQLTVTTIYYQ